MPPNRYHPYKHGTDHYDDVTVYDHGTPLVACSDVDCARSHDYVIAVDDFHARYVERPRLHDHHDGLDVEHDHDGTAVNHWHYHGSGGYFHVLYDHESPIFDNVDSAGEQHPDHIVSAAPTRTNNHGRGPGT